MVQVRFDEQGLVPVIVQDVETNEVLTLAYMNQESLTLTLKDRLMTFIPAVAKNCGAKEKPAAITSI